MKFDKDNLCPNCNSGRHIKKGRNQSCWGIGFEKGFICTREELKSKTQVTTGFYHWYDKCDCGRDHGGTMVTPTIHAEMQQSKKDNQEYAVHLWKESIPISNPSCNSRLYLRRRGIVLDNSELRYHPSLQHAKSGNKEFEVLIARVSDINDQTIAIQRIYLDGANKANIDPNKMTLGSPIGGAVKLGKPRGGIISICEGLETGLSVQQMFNVPVWVSLGSTFMHKIKLPSKDVVHTVRIYADGDDAGTSAIKKFQEQYSKDYKIEDYQAPTGTDYNDMLMAQSERNGISRLMDYIKKRFK